jgi:hypothetical protein
MRAPQVTRVYGLLAVAKISRNLQVEAPRGNYRAVQSLEAVGQSSPVSHGAVTSHGEQSSICKRLGTPLLWICWFPIAGSNAGDW